MAKWWCVEIDKFLAQYLSPEKKKLPNKIKHTFTDNNIFSKYTVLRGAAEYTSFDILDI